MVYDCEVEVPDGTTVIPKYHTFQAPPANDGHYAMMRGGWILIEGEKPEYPPPPPIVDPEQQKILFNETQKNARAQAYRDESDPIYFKVQRGEANMQEWLDKVEEIKLKFQYAPLYLVT